MIDDIYHNYFLEDFYYGFVFLMLVPSLIGVGMETRAAEILVKMYPGRTASNNKAKHIFGLFMLVLSHYRT